MRFIRGLNDEFTPDFLDSAVLHVGTGLMLQLSHMLNSRPDTLPCGGEGLPLEARSFQQCSGKHAASKGL